MCALEHRRRLVINIGGKNLGQKYWGGKNLGKIFFQTTLEKHFWKNPLLFSKISEDLFLVIDNFFQKFTPFIQNALPFLCILLSLSLLLLSFMFLRVTKQKFVSFSSDYWGWQKMGFAPILIIGGACLGCPQSLRLCFGEKCKVWFNRKSRQFTTFEETNDKCWKSLQTIHYIWGN